MRPQGTFGPKPQNHLSDFKIPVKIHLYIDNVCNGLLKKLIK